MVKQIWTFKITNSDGDVVFSKIMNVSHMKIPTSPEYISPDVSEYLSDEDTDKIDSLCLGRYSQVVILNELSLGSSYLFHMDDLIIGKEVTTITYE